MMLPEGLNKYLHEGTGYTYLHNLIDMVKETWLVWLQNNDIHKEFCEWAPLLIKANTDIIGVSFSYCWLNLEE